MNCSGLFSLNRRVDLNISLIAAIGKNGTIGKDGGIPWHCSEDLAFFKSLTSQPDTALIMGRVTYDSLPGNKLSNRFKAVITSSTEFRLTSDDCKFFNSLDDAYQYLSAQGYKQVFICGGASIYEQTLSLARTAHLSLVRSDTEGDTFFPIVKALKKNWKLEDITWLGSDCITIKLIK